MDFQFIKLLTDTLVNVRFMCRGLFLGLNGNMLLYIPNIRTLLKKKNPAASVVLSSISSFCREREKKKCPFPTT